MNRNNLTVSMDKLKFCIVLEKETEVTVRKKLGKGFYCRKNIFNSDSYIIEFNPNKVLKSINSADNEYILKTIIAMIEDTLNIDDFFNRVIYFTRADFAIDVKSKFKKKYFELIKFTAKRVKQKTQCKNTLYFHSSNKEYAGTTLAIYNKSLESKLDDNIIRYEFRYYRNKNIKNQFDIDDIFAIEKHVNKFKEKLLNDLFSYEHIPKNKFNDDLNKLKQELGVDISPNSLDTIIKTIQGSEKLNKSHKYNRVTKFKKLWKSHLIKNDRYLKSFIDEQREFLSVA